MEMYLRTGSRGAWGSSAEGVYGGDKASSGHIGESEKELQEAGGNDYAKIGNRKYGVRMS